MLGVLVYVGFYLIVFPKNYYGGGQSLGDRYFVQMAPAILVAALFAPLEAETLRWLSLAAVALSLIFTLPHHLDPSGAYGDISAPARRSGCCPLEANQDYTYLLRGEPAPATPPPP